MGFSFRLGGLKTHGLSDGYVVESVIHPGGTTGWQVHPGPSLIFVIRGAVTKYTSDDPSCSGRVYSSGSGFVDAGGRDVQLLPKDAPRRIAAEAPADCSS